MGWKKIQVKSYLFQSSNTSTVTFFQYKIFLKKELQTVIIRASKMSSENMYIPGIGSRGNKNYDLIPSTFVFPGWDYNPTVFSFSWLVLLWLICRHTDWIQTWLRVWYIHHHVCRDVCTHAIIFIIIVVILIFVVTLG